MRALVRMCLMAAVEKPSCNWLGHSGELRARGIEPCRAARSVASGSSWLQHRFSPVFFALRSMCVCFFPRRPPELTALPGPSLRQRAWITQIRASSGVGGADPNSLNRRQLCQGGKGSALELCGCTENSGNQITSTGVSGNSHSCQTQLGLACWVRESPSHCHSSCGRHMRVLGRGGKFQLRRFILSS